MFPLQDTEKNRYSPLPWMNYSIILVNIIVFIFITIPIATNDNRLLYPSFLYKYGSTPYLIMTQTGMGVIASITSMFLHGGFSHIFLNMFPLAVFGRRVEDALGPIRYLFFYLLAGVSADILSTVVHWGDPIPSIGASGAVFGIMGAYLVLYPTGRIRTFFLIPFIGIPLWPRLRAYWVILYFFALQIIPAYQVLIGDTSARVNYWAHLGGFFTAILVQFFLRPEAYQRYISDVDV